MKRTLALTVLAVLGATSLTACYVIPLDHNARPSNVAYAPLPTPVSVAPQPASLIARLYPSNDAASPFGILIGQVVNNLNGRGSLTVNMGGEQFTGEATRDGQSASNGNANGVGSRGGYMKCTYVMNSTTQGSGECTFSNGARFRLHLAN
jgi:hypothetical protein